MQISLQFHEYFLTKNVKIVISRRFEIFDIIVRISTCPKKFQKLIWNTQKFTLQHHKGCQLWGRQELKRPKSCPWPSFRSVAKRMTAFAALFVASTSKGSKAFHAPLYSWLMALRYIQEPSPPVEWRPFFTKFPFASFALSTPWRKSSLACWDTPDETRNCFEKITRF